MMSVANIIAQTARKTNVAMNESNWNYMSSTLNASFFPTPQQITKLRCERNHVFLMDDRYGSGRLISRRRLAEAFVAK